MIQGNVLQFLQRNVKIIRTSDLLVIPTIATHPSYEDINTIFMVFLPMISTKCPSINQFLYVI